MKKVLFRNFLLIYIFIGIAGFLVVTVAGSFMAEKKMEKSFSENLYREAHHIAADDNIRHSISSSNLETVRDNLSAIAEYQDSIIWIINSSGEIMLSTRTDISSEEPIEFSNFDPTAWGSNYYQIGDFYGYFSQPCLSVIAPITENMTTKGYVCIHYFMSKLYQNRSNILFIFHLLFGILFLLTGVLVVFFYFYVERPLRIIANGTGKFAGGNLAYRIPLKSDDEIGYLAKTLNYTAEKLNRNGEYQRKFISNVSHDFRSPLTSIKGYVEAMLDGTIPAEMQEKYLKIISYEAGRLEKLTKSLLTLNELDIQKRMMHFRKFDINEVIKTTAATFEGICTERKILLELVLSGKELYAKADMEQIQQVLYNLLDNAIKFSYNGSSIVIETTEKNDKIFVSVKDRGEGIPKACLPKIWDRFYKSDSSRGKDRKGTGLGLSIVQEIIHAHGQNINVISTEGVGTEFIFTLDKAR